MRRCGLVSLTHLSIIEADAIRRDNLMKNFAQLWLALHSPDLLQAGQHSQLAHQYLGRSPALRNVLPQPSTQDPRGAASLSRQQSQQGVVSAPGMAHSTSQQSWTAELGRMTLETSQQGHQAPGPIPILQFGATALADHAERSGHREHFQPASAPAPCA